MRFALDQLDVLKTMPGKHSERTEYFLKSSKFLVIHVFLTIVFLFVTMYTDNAFADQSNHQSKQDLFRDCENCPLMKIVPNGEFYMNRPPVWQGRPFGSGPMRKVLFDKPFAISVYEITIAEWNDCVAKNGCKKEKNSSEKDNQFPVSDVTWYEATEYISWLSNKTGYKYRLPSEAEWEYSARSGAGRSRYFGLADAEVCDYGNVYDITAQKKLNYEWDPTGCEDAYSRKSPVGSFKPNNFGLFDTIGNVWEWVEDCKSQGYGTRYMGNRSGPVLRGDCSFRSFRGGSWLSSPPEYIRPEDRFRFAGSSAPDLGFRVVKQNP